MCLAIPMRVVDLDLPMGTVELDGIRRRVHLGFIEDVQAGDYVLVHAGCAVERLRPEEAEEDLRLLRQLLYDTPEGLGGIDFSTERAATDPGAPPSRRDEPTGDDTAVEPERS